MSPKNKIYIIAIIFGTISLILILLLVYPLFNEIKKNSQELIGVKGELITFETQIKELENFRKIYANYQENLEKINQLFIDPKVPIDFIQFLEKTASGSGISIEISPQIFSQKEIKTELWSSTGFQISTTGSFLNSLKFLEKLESSQYLIEIQNLNLAKLTPQDYIKASFLIKVFTKPR